MDPWPWRNRIADALAKMKPDERSDHVRIITSRPLHKWQQKWSTDDMGRFCQYIFPIHHALDGTTQRPEIRTASRIAANHYCWSEHLHRIQVVLRPICQHYAANSYESIDHILFHRSSCQANRDVILRTINRRHHFRVPSARNTRLKFEELTHS